MKTTYVSLLASLCVSPLFASEPTFSAIGAGCVPTGQTTDASVHFNSAGDTTFFSTDVGEIILTCPVPATLLSASRIDMTYRDTDGAGVAARVVASLRRKNLSNAAVVDVAQARVDSNLKQATSTYANMANNIAVGGCGDYAFDHSNYAYYVQVNMTRTTTSQQAIFASVRLSTAIC